MPRNREVKIQHGEEGVEGYVLPESVAVYERYGWTVVDDGSNELQEEVVTEQRKNIDPERPKVTRRVEEGKE